MWKGAGEEAEGRCGHKQHSQQGEVAGIPQALGLGFPSSKQGREHAGCAGERGSASVRNEERKEESEFSSSKIGQRKLGKIAWRGNARRKEGGKRMKSTANSH